MESGTASRGAGSRAAEALRKRQLPDLGMSRRQLLQVAGLGAGALGLAACGPLSSGSRGGGGSSGPAEIGVKPAEGTSGYKFLVEVGDKVTANGRFGEIESVKATSDLYSGVAGTITAVNNELGNEPGLVNRDPYNAGWMIKLKATNPADVNKLLSVEEYLEKTGH